ncbi:MAG: hypothetical protein IJV50_09130 [Lachnospiraceae bacterium]|nr:hypothetical protein [Lachnospiraceae bacterium]
MTLAGQVIQISALYPTTKEFCKDYLVEDGTEQLADLTPAITIIITPEDIQYEQEKSAREDEVEGIPVRHFSEPYLETLAVYRKIAEQMPFYDTILFHGSAIAVDGEAYLFTAKSGTGKSTHTRFWRDYFGERAVMVNDDKPLIRITQDGVTVYGTPWNGKHRLGSHISAPLKAICLLERDKENHIEVATAKELYPRLLQQTYRPGNPAAMMQTLQLMDELTGQVGLYRLGCNLSPEAAKVAYEGIHSTEFFK